MKNPLILEETSESKARREEFRRLVDIARERDGISSYRAWADHWHISRSALTDVLYGRETSAGTITKPSLDTLNALAIALKKPLHELAYLAYPDAYGAEEASPGVDQVDQVSVQVAGWVGAGPEQFHEAIDTSIYIDKRMVGKRSVLAFFIVGDSMDAGKRPIANGDLVLVDTNDKGSDSSSVVARLREGYVCKLLKRDRFGVKLYSRNADYTNGTPPVVEVDDETKIVGTVFLVLSGETVKDLLAS